MFVQGRTCKTSYSQMLPYFPQSSLQGLFSGLPLPTKDGISKAAQRSLCS